MVVDFIKERSPSLEPEESRSDHQSSASVAVSPEEEDPPLSDPGSFSADSEHHTSDGKLIIYDDEFVLVYFCVYSTHFPYFFHL